MHSAYHHATVYFAENASTASITSNIVAFYKMEEASGSRFDSTGNGRTLSVNGAPTTVPGKIGNGIQFNRLSANQYLFRSDETGLRLMRPGQTGFTVTAWMNHATTTGIQTIVCKDAGGATDREWIIASINGQPRVEVLDATGATVSIATYGSTLSTATWYFLAMTYDSTNGTSISINNANAVTGAATGTANPGSTGEFHIGLQVAGNGNFFDGIIDAVGVWNRVLSATELAQMYNSGAGKELP